MGIFVYALFGVKLYIIAYFFVVGFGFWVGLPLALEKFSIRKALSTKNQKTYFTLANSKSSAAYFLREGFFSSASLR